MVHRIRFIGHLGTQRSKHGCYLGKGKRMISYKNPKIQTQRAEAPTAESPCKRPAPLSTSRLFWETSSKGLVHGHWPSPEKQQVAQVAVPPFPLSAALMLKQLHRGRRLSSPCCPQHLQQSHITGQCFLDEQKAA